MYIPTFRQLHQKRGTSKDVTDIPLQEIQKMDAEKILERFSLVIYSKEDVQEINQALDVIRQVLKKNTDKLKNGRK